MTDLAMREVGSTNGRGSHQLAKSSTGILGLDEVTGGGFPTGRPTLILVGLQLSPRTW